jgi:site-specific DNA recombinase
MKHGEAGRASPGSVRVAIYSRYSTDSQNPRSVSDQVKLCQRWVERQGWPPVPPEAIYSDEAISGGTTHRSSYQRLLSEIAGSDGRPAYNVIVVEDLSRLTREMLETSRIIQMAPLWSLRIVGVSDGQDTAMPGSKYAMAYKGISNEQFLDDLHDKIRRGLSGRFEDGYHAGGSAFGFRTVPVLHPSGKVDRWGRPQLSGHRLEPHPEQAPVIRRIFTEAAAGVSPRDICAGLDRDAVPKPCAGYQFTKAASRARGRWNPPSVLSMLKDERFRGLWRWQQTICVARDPDTGRKVMRAAPEGEALEQHRPGLQLVDDRTWVKVQEVLAARAEGVRRDPKTGRLMGRAQGCAPGKGYGNAWHGLVYCGECGGPFPVIMTKPAKDGRPIHYLGCNRRHYLKERCGNAGVCRLADLDAALGDGLEGYFSDTTLAKKRMKRFLDSLAAERRKLTKEEAAAERQRAEAEREIERVKRAILDGHAGPTTAAMLRDGEAERAAAEQKVAAAAQARDAKPAMLPPAEVLAALKTEAYHERRTAYRQLVQRVELRSRRGPGRHQVEGWEATIFPRREAGIQGVPKVVFGRVIASGVLLLEEVPHPVVPAVEGPPQSGVRRDRMQRARVRFPVRTRRWAWFGRRAQA